MMSCFQNTLNLNSAKKYLILALLVYSKLAWSQSGTSDIPLSFPAEQNKIQALPQRFEYTVIDSEKIKIGDILIDANFVRFELLKTKKINQFRIRFSWPANLIQEGKIYLVDNVGKAIWSSNFYKKHLKISKITNPETPELRADMAQYISQALPLETINSMKFYPFMKFCVATTDLNTRIELCSKELYLSQTQNTLIIKSRSTNLKQSLVTVNGQSVGQQGLIFLNDKSEAISFRSKTISGSSLDIETRLKDVEFKDVTLGSDQKTIIFEASGAEPATESNIERMPNNHWRAKLSIERPIIYLQGEGGIPLRQEFFIRGAVPNETARTYLKAGTIDKTYNSTVVVSGFSSPGTIVSNLKNENTLKTLSNNQFTWTLDHLKKGETNRRFVLLTSNNESWVGAYDITRGYAGQLGLLSTYLAPWGLASAELSVNYWFENFLNINSRLTRHRWGVGLSQETSFTNKSGTPKFSLMTFGLNYRLTPGLNYKDPTLGLKILSNKITLESAAASGLGVGFFWQRPSPEWIPNSFSWTTLEASYLLPVQTSDLDFKGLVKLQGLVSMPFKSAFMFDLGCSIENWSQPASSNIDSLQLGLQAGAKYLF